MALTHFFHNYKREAGGATDAAELKKLLETHAFEGRMRTRMVRLGGKQTWRSRGVCGQEVDEEEEAEEDEENDDNIRA